jgi:hypothetical protein
MAAPTILHGRFGTMNWSDGTNLIGPDGVTAWTIDITTNMIDINSVDEKEGMARLSGIKSWTATVDTLDSDIAYTELNMFDTPAVGVSIAKGLGKSATLTLSDGTNTVGGTAYLRSWTKTLDIDGIFTWTFDFLGNGALS